VAGLSDAQLAEVAAEAEERSRELTALLRMDEEQLARLGCYPVSVVHGYPDTPENARLIFDMLPRLAEECGPPVLMQGGHDYRTYVFRGPGSKDAAARFTVAVAERGESWWRVTQTARPQYRR
jgi:hypothetical protein